MAQIDEMAVVEWDPTNRSIHIDTISEILERNLYKLRKGENPGSFPIAIADTPEEASRMADRLEAELK